MSAAVVHVPRPRIAAQAAAAPARATRRPAARPALRLTRLGRLVVTLAFLVLLVTGTVLLGSQSTATGERGTSEATTTVVVGRGDTLWEIAAKVAAPGEVREMVHRIEKLNALPGPAIVEGQELAVPRR